MVTSRGLGVQVLTALFTYFNIIVLPWRLAIFKHVVDHRSDAPGRDFYGRPTEAIWFHIPRRPRVWIVFFLLASEAMHFTTQTARFFYPSYEASNAMPGVLVCNVPFGLAVLLGMIGGIIQGQQEKKLTKANPDHYPPSLLGHIFELRRRGEISCCALLCSLLCCRLAKSHDEVRTRWHAQKELAKIALAKAKQRAVSRTSAASAASAGAAGAADAEKGEGSLRSGSVFAAARHRSGNNKSQRYSHNQRRRTGLGLSDGKSASEHAEDTARFGDSPESKAKADTYGE